MESKEDGEKLLNGCVCVVEVMKVMEGENKLPAVGVAGPHVGQQWSSE